MAQLHDRYMMMMMVMMMMMMLMTYSTAQLAEGIMVDL